MSHVPRTRGAGISNRSNSERGVETYRGTGQWRSDYSYDRWVVPSLVVQPVAQVPSVPSVPSNAKDDNVAIEVPMVEQGVEAA